MAASAIYPSLKDKHVVITGGATGIGEALVTAFARQGSRVTFLDVQAAAGRALVERLRTEGNHPDFHVCDVTDLAALAGFFGSVDAVDVLVNNAGNDDRHSLEDVTPGYWDDRINVNLRHMLFSAKAVAPGMKKKGAGCIVNFGSISWHLGLPDLVLYETSKAAIEGMTRALARELGPSGIRVTSVLPGNIKTPRQMQWYTPEGEADIVRQQCLKARVLPEHVASLVLFLASDDAAMCTGHEYWIDGGWR
ncbi:MAG TPA: SDR family oxidoreductase [Rhizomicrobium sp.]